MNVDVILGLQWGDEGKGKIVDVLTPRYDVIARFQGGPNAGHTIEFDHRKFVLHTIPSGIFHAEKTNVIGNGVIIDPFIFFQEVDNLLEAGIHPEKNLLISRRSHMILPTHRLLDAAYEAQKGDARIGSTLKGIGPTYTDKYARTGLRTGAIHDHDFRMKYDQLKETHLDIIRGLHFDYASQLIDGLSFEDYESAWFRAVERLKGFQLIDSEFYLNRCLDSGKSVLAEGAQGSMLDVDFGSYPFVTSSNTITAGVCSGLGVSPHRIGTVFGVFKAYCTRVGSGPFPTELHDATGELMRKSGHEFGATTGRPRRCGWLDIPALKYAIMLNGVNSLIMMKADVLTSIDPVNICTQYEVEGKRTEELPWDLSPEKLVPVYTPMKGWSSDLSKMTAAENFPSEINEYIRFIEKVTGVPVTMVSVGPDREQTISR
ncbi:MAG TPA: adenylosuccinate synthase [Bacteroidales bacterium]|nr:adenylosuccinate synthase [Bacteroidales bacterium]